VGRRKKGKKKKPDSPHVKSAKEKWWKEVALKNNAGKDAPHNQ